MFPGPGCLPVRVKLIWNFCRSSFGALAALSARVCAARSHWSPLRIAAPICPRPHDPVLSSSLLRAGALLLRRRAEGGPGQPRPASRPARLCAGRAQARRLDLMPLSRTIPAPCRRPPPLLLPASPRGSPLTQDVHGRTWMSKVGAPMGNFYRFQLRFFSLIGPETPRLCQWENETRFRLKEPPAKQVTLDGSGARPDTRPAACVPGRCLLTPALSNPPPHTHADPRWRGQMFAVVCAQTHWVAQLDRGPSPRAGVARGRAGACCGPQRAQRGWLGTARDCGRPRGGQVFHPERSETYLLVPDRHQYRKWMQVRSSSPPTPCCSRRGKRERDSAMHSNDLERTGQALG